MPAPENPDQAPHEDAPENGEDDDEVAAGAACPICEMVAGDCDHLVASIDLTYSEVIAGALFAHGSAVLHLMEHLCGSDPDGLKVAGAGPVLEHVAILVQNEIAEGASPGDALSIYTTQILAALSLLLQEDEDVTATNVDEDSSIENLWAQDPEWAVERLVERLEGLVNEVDEDRREER